MRFEELDQDMQQIILECQTDFIRDGQQRLTQVDGAFQQWKSGAMDAKAAAEVLLQHAHSMKGVARTIYFEPFHEQSERTTDWIRERLADEWDEVAILQLIDHAANLHAAFAKCVLQHASNQK